MRYSILTVTAAFFGNAATLLFSFYYYFYANSTALLYSVFISLSGIFCSILTILFIIQKARGKHFKFAYGTNRLENLNAFVISLIMFISVIITFISLVERINGPDHNLENFITIPISLMVGFITQLVLLLIAKKSMTLDISPILVILYKDAKVGTYRNLGSVLLVVALWLINVKDGNYCFWLDKILAFSFCCYGTYVYLSQIYYNYKALSDYPLDEKEQLFILNILSRHFHDFNNVGKIYTTTKGNDFIVEIELLFPPAEKIQNVIELQRKMLEEFKERYKNGQLRLFLVD